MYIEKLTNADIIKLSKMLVPNNISCIFIKKTNSITLIINQKNDDLEFCLTDFDIVSKNKSAKVWMEKFSLDNDYFKFMSEKFGEEYENGYFESDNSFMKSIPNFYNA